MNESCRVESLRRRVGRVPSSGRTGYINREGGEEIERCIQLLLDGRRHAGHPQPRKDEDRQLHRISILIEVLEKMMDARHARVLSPHSHHRPKRSGYGSRPIRRDVRLGKKKLARLSRRKNEPRRARSRTAFGGASGPRRSRARTWTSRSRAWKKHRIRSTRIPEPPGRGEGPRPRPQRRSVRAQGARPRARISLRSRALGRRSSRARPARERNPLRSISLTNSRSGSLHLFDGPRNILSRSFGGRS